jgi:hypothetical protein
MMTLTLLIILLFAGLISLGVVFYYLHSRVESLTKLVSTTRREADILYSNQQALEGDIKKLFNELQNVNKEASRIRGK